MDNVVNFLLDYYIWILAVLAIVIITIIGFLVDSKQKRKKKEVAEVQTVQSMPDTNVNGNINFNNGQIPSVNGNGVGEMNSAVTNQMPVQSFALKQPVNSFNEISNSTGNNEVSLSNQKPHFESSEVQVQNYVKPSLVNEQVMVPRPVNAVSINTPIQPQVNIPVINQNTVGGASQSYVPSQSQEQQMVNVMPVYNNMQTMQSQVSAVPNQNNFVQNGIMYKNQQPVNYQNVSAQPSISMSYQQQSGMPVSSNVVGQGNIMAGVQMQQPVVSNSNNSQPIVTATNNLGIGFVTGESIPTGDDDSWKL